ncbi:MAG TPA: hypothetical protein VMV45_09725 [Casimicrobiaceae bacterium]|nr:hypothetical protein [Casimicrobiaceae bacterium]
MIDALEGRMRSVSSFVTFAFAACCAPAIGAQTSPAVTPHAMSFVCDGLDVIARTTQAGIELTLPDRRVVLPPAPSGTADEYQEGDITFRRRGDQADVEIGGTAYSNCSFNAERSGWDDAKLRGISFRAVGRAPGWSLELDDQRSNEISVVFADGRSVALPTPTPVVAGTRVTYKASSRDFTLAIETASCRDPVSGESLSETVALRLDGVDYRACGRWLQRGQHGY